jgi:hypothetical protein
MTFIGLKKKFNCFEFRLYCFISTTFHLFIDSYYIILLKHAPKNKTFNKHSLKITILTEFYTKQRCR